MGNQILFAILGSVVLLGSALFWVLRADRRKAGRQQRLKEVALAAAPSADGLRASLRRALPQRGMRGFFLLPAALWTRLDAALGATGNTIGVPHLILTGTVAAAVVISLASRVLGLNPLFVIIFGGAAAAAAPTLLLRLAQSRYQRRFLDIFPDALDLVGRAVRAGLPVADAMEVAAREIGAPVGSELQQTLDATRIGVEMEEALQRTANRIRVPDFRFYVVALALQRRTGGSLAETLANLSNIIRRRKEIRLKTRALTAESRASAIVLGVMPFVFVAGLSVLNPKLLSTLLVDPRGRFMVGYALLSVFTGIGVMFWMIKRSLR